MADQIKITATLAKLDKEIGGGDPYILGLPGNKRLIFEDFTSWSGDRAEVAEELLDISSGFKDSPLDKFAQKWLSEKDFKVWQAQGLSFRQKATILQNAAKYVLRDMTPGESDASAS